MATATPDVTVELFALILDEDEPPCMIPDCATSARWAVRCEACGIDWHFCDHHRKVAENAAAKFGGVRCDMGFAGCNAPIFWPLPWRPI